MNIAWGISGAAKFLSESFEAMEKVAAKHKVTALLSKAGERIVTSYGLEGRLKKISPGGYLQEVVTAKSQAPIYPITGRFFQKRYDALVVSPATSNLVAKVVAGISDSLLTNAVAHAQKSMTPVYLCPVDAKAGYANVELPYYIDKELCRRCAFCEPQHRCPKIAISGFRIDLLRCNSCGVCIALCPFGAIIGEKKVKMRVRKIDAANVRKLRRMDGVKVLRQPGEVLKHVKA